MSSASTAARTPEAYLISKTTERTLVVIGSPSHVVRSAGSSPSADTRNPACARTSAQLVASQTSYGAPPGPVPPNHRPPSQRRAAQPVTPPYLGRAAPASTMRCSGEVRSTELGT